nr:hypothetical protein [Abalone asfa-like virus]
MSSHENFAMTPISAEQEYKNLEKGQTFVFLVDPLPASLVYIGHMSNITVKIRVKTPQNTDITHEKGISFREGACDLLFKKCKLYRDSTVIYENNFLDVSKHMKTRFVEIPDQVYNNNTEQIIKSSRYLKQPEMTPIPSFCEETNLIQNNPIILTRYLPDIPYFSSEGEKWQQNIKLRLELEVNDIGKLFITDEQFGGDPIVEIVESPMLWISQFEIRDKYEIPSQRPIKDIIGEQWDVQKIGEVPIGATSYASKEIIIDEEPKSAYLVFYKKKLYEGVAPFSQQLHPLLSFWAGLDRLEMKLFNTHMIFQMPEAKHRLKVKYLFNIMDKTPNTLDEFITTEMQIFDHNSGGTGCFMLFIQDFYACKYGSKSAMVDNKFQVFGEFAEPTTEDFITLFVTKRTIKND